MFYYLFRLVIASIYMYKHFEICPIHLCMHPSPCLVLNCTNPHFYLHVCRPRLRRSKSMSRALLEVLLSWLVPKIRGLRLFLLKLCHFLFICLLGSFGLVIVPPT